MTPTISLTTPKKSNSSLAVILQLSTYHSLLTMFYRLFLYIYYTLLSFLIHLIPMVILQKKRYTNVPRFLTIDMFCEMVEMLFEHECLLLGLDEMKLLLFYKPLHPPDENNCLHSK